VCWSGIGIEENPYEDRKIMHSGTDKLIVTEHDLCFNYDDRITSRDTLQITFKIIQRMEIYILDIYLQMVRL
jgi:hypothetical protein